MFDALGYSHKLEEAGFTKKQAEESVRLLMEILNENLATKNDLKELRTELKNEIKEVKTSLQNEMNMRFFETNTKINSLESKLIYKLGALMFLVQGAFVTLAKFI